MVPEGGSLPLIAARSRPQPPVAHYTAIAVASRALVGLLEDAIPRDRFPNARFLLIQASDFEGNVRPVTEGVTVYLYRVAFSTTRRTLPPRTDRLGRRFRPPIPVDLSFLVTAWSSDAQQGQRLLGWAIRTLADTPVVPAGYLNRFVAGSEDVFGATESVELVGDQISLQDLDNIWDVARSRQQPSAAYLIRQLALDSEVSMQEHPPVQTRVFGPGQLETP